MAKETFECTLPHFNVGTIGHEGHGKTSLTAAITSVQAAWGRAVSCETASLDKSPQERDLGRTLITSHVEYTTAARHYAHIDCPGHHATGRNVYTGVAQLDGVILVVSAVEGVKAQTREHIVLARQAGISQIIVFMNKCDVEVESGRVQFIEEELRELLNSYEYPGDSTPFIRGSALGALRGDAEHVEGIQRLLSTMDDFFTTPERNTDSDFLMPIADSLVIWGEGNVVIGSIARGFIRVGDEVEIVGLLETQRTVVTGVETFNKLLYQGAAGDHVGLRLRGTKREGVRRGQVVVRPGSVRPHTKVEAMVYILESGEGGRHTPFLGGYRPQIHLHTADVPCTVRLAEGTEMIMPGDHAGLTLEFMKPLYVQKGQRFVLRDGGRTIGAGTITSIIA
jgi:elongation factor Tu